MMIYKYFFFCSHSYADECEYRHNSFFPLLLLHSFSLSAVLFRFKSNFSNLNRTETLQVDDTSSCLKRLIHFFLLTAIAMEIFYKCFSNVAEYKIQKTLMKSNISRIYSTFSSRFSIENLLYLLILLRLRK